MHVPKCWDRTPYLWRKRACFFVLNFKPRSAQAVRVPKDLYPNKFFLCIHSVLTKIRTSNQLLKAYSGVYYVVCHHFKKRYKKTLKLRDRKKAVIIFVSGKSSEMGGDAKQEQFGLGYGHKNMFEVWVYF